MRSLLLAVLTSIAIPHSLLAQSATQAVASSDTLVTAAILAPSHVLPAESATAAITKFSFIAYGDTRGRHDGIQLQSEHQLVVESMLASAKRVANTPDPIRFVVESGDAVVNGSIAAQLNVSYIPLINRLTQEADLPYFLAVGNHDMGTSADLADVRRLRGLRNFEATNRNLIPQPGSPRRLDGYPTYAFGFGNSFFIAFDSNIPDDSTQFAWVSSQLDQLDRARYTNIVLFFHHPAFSSGPHGGATVERQTASIRALWMPLFRKHHVKLLLTGHEHLFEHWVERYSDATGAHRIDQIVSGGGGAPLVSYEGEPDLREYRQQGADAKVRVEHLVQPSVDPGANPFHYLIVHVDGEQISVEVVGVDWGRGFAPYRSNGVILRDRP